MVTREHLSLEVTALVFEQLLLQYCKYFGTEICVYHKKGKVHPCTGTEALYRSYGQ